MSTGHLQRQSGNQESTQDAESATGSWGRKEGRRQKWKSVSFSSHQSFPMLTSRLNALDAQTWLLKYVWIRPLPLGKQTMIPSTMQSTAQRLEDVTLVSSPWKSYPAAASGSATVGGTEDECLTSWNRMNVSCFGSLVYTFYLCAAWNAAASSRDSCPRPRPLSYAEGN